VNHVILPIIAHEMFVDSLRNSKKYTLQWWRRKQKTS